MNPSPEMVPVRRKDRVVSDEAWIEEMLTHAPVGVLALTRDGQPFVNMNIFLYDASRHALYLHGATDGQTRTHVEANEKVCFCIHEMGRLLPAMYARNFSVEYGGVVCFGRITTVTDPDEARTALQRLLDKYAPHLESGKHYRPITDAELEQTSVYRVQIERWSGKKKVAPADHPGAFRYGDVDPPPPWDDWRQQEAKS